MDQGTPQHGNTQSAISTADSTAVQPINTSEWHSPCSLGSSRKVSVRSTTSCAASETIARASGAKTTDVSMCFQNVCWWVVWNMAFMTFHILGRIIPTDEFIFFRGLKPPTSQYDQSLRIPTVAVADDIFQFWCVLKTLSFTWRESRLEQIKQSRYAITVSSKSEAENQRVSLFMNFTDGPLRFVSFFIRYFLSYPIIDWFSFWLSSVSISLLSTDPFSLTCILLSLGPFPICTLKSSSKRRSTESVQYLIRTLGVQLVFFMIPSDQLELHMLPTSTPVFIKFSGSNHGRCIKWCHLPSVNVSSIAGQVAIAWNLDKICINRKICKDCCNHPLILSDP